LREAPLAEGDVWEEGRHDPKHPIWGVVGSIPLISMLNRQSYSRTQLLLG
jgi:hypothetical protein